MTEILEQLALIKELKSYYKDNPNVGQNFSKIEKRLLLEIEKFEQQMEGRNNGRTKKSTKTKDKTKDASSRSEWKR